MLVLTRNYDFMEYKLDHFTLYNIKNSIMNAVILNF